MVENIVGKEDNFCRREVKKDKEKIGGVNRKWVQ